MAPSAPSVSEQTIAQAAARIEDKIVNTPCVRSETLSKQLGCELYIKFENQQFTASFKERGALNRLLLRQSQSGDPGVVAMSAGNHAQALAYHGAQLGVPVTIVMPRSTPQCKGGGDSGIRSRCHTPRQHL